MCRAVCHRPTAVVLRRRYPAATRVDPLLLTGYPDVRRYLSARFLVGIAVQMQTVAVGWQVYETTHNPLDLGLIGLSQFLPFVILVLPAGHIADRYDRRRVILACYLLAAVASALLTVFALTGVTSVLPIFIVMALFGVVRAFNMPTSQALLPNLVPRSTSATRWRSTPRRCRSPPSPARRWRAC